MLNKEVEYDPKVLTPDDRFTTQSGLYICNKCKKTFTKKYRAQEHASSCFGDPKDSICPHCKKAYKYDDLRNHLTHYIRKLKKIQPTEAAGDNKFQSIDYFEGLLLQIKMEKKSKIKL